MVNSSEDSNSQFSTSSAEMSMKSKNGEYTFKILVIGDICTGKTSIIRRYVHNLFSSQYQATIGVDFAMKIFHCSNSSTARLQFWDIAGQERFSSMTRVYYRGAAGAIIVFDVSRASTLDGVTRWKKDLDSKCRLSNGMPIPAILLANKSDLLKHYASEQLSKLDSFCAKHGFVGWFATSAKLSTGIAEAVSSLCEHASMIMVEINGNFEIPVVSAISSIELTDQSDQKSVRKERKATCCRG
ncbi:Ras-related protein Rab-32 [Trichinella pseudospiralis]|uniref:Ras-related protein Rab n=1 Tax=Trichinella pseudospiralis TaxID=6337 RepID=A0A0V0YCW0_TRIPS|nr:Ras-related protein Rab-32 [Trichinella pseudospiralis]